MRCFSPANDAIDEPFDYEYFPDCSGARSLCMMVSYTSRTRECGDGLWADKQSAFAEFANLAATTWRGEAAYVVPIDATTTEIALNGTLVPVYGRCTAIVDRRLRTILPMSPNARHQLAWLREWVAAHGREATAEIRYGGVSATFQIAFVPAGLAHNLERF
jgi:hypothetical protein